MYRSLKVNEVFFTRDLKGKATGIVRVTSLMVQNRPRLIEVMDHLTASGNVTTIDHIDASDIDHEREVTLDAVREFKESAKAASVRKIDSLYSMK